MKIPFHKKWYLIEREDYANYLFVTAAWEGDTHLPRKWGFPVGRYLGAEYINSACNLFILKENFDEMNMVNFQYLFVRPELWHRLQRINKKNADTLFVWANRIKRLNPRKLTNKKLLDAVLQFNVFQKEVHDPRGAMWLLETPDTIVSNYLHGYLGEQAHVKRNVKTPPFKAFQLMTAPLEKNLWAQEKEDLARIGLIHNKESMEKALTRHSKKYEWLEYGLQGKILEPDYFRKELDKILRRGPGKFLRDSRNEIVTLNKKQKAIIREYHIHPRHQQIFKIAQYDFFVRLYSKNSQFYGYYCLENIFKEIGRRGGLTLEQVRFLASEDFRQILMHHKDYSRITAERQKYSIHISDKGETVFYHGAQARRIRKKLKFITARLSVKDTEVIKGQPAYEGKATGRVKIINTVQEMVKMHAGNILVSHMTNPDIVPVMKQASAIVTDLGGITSHAAIVARELKKPCVIGTKIATQVLKDGDMVEVDANRGIVNKL